MTPEMKLLNTTTRGHIPTAHALLLMTAVSVLSALLGVAVALLVRAG